MFHVTFLLLMTRALFLHILGRTIPISIDSKCLESGCHYAEVMVATVSGIENIHD